MVPACKDPAGKKLPGCFMICYPKQGRILDIGCGYGFMSYMLHFAAPERDLIGYDYDEEKIAVANHCFSRDKNIHFMKADVNRLDISAA